MLASVLYECTVEDLEKKVLEAWASGERFVIKGDEGPLAAIIPVEDLAVLEEIERDIPQKLEFSRRSLDEGYEQL